jgi:hypothetical protein
VVTSTSAAARRLCANEDPVSEDEDAEDAGEEDEEEAEEEGEGEDSGGEQRRPRERVALGEEEARKPSSPHPGGGLHFLGDERKPRGEQVAEDPGTPGAEPEVRKQVGWHPNALRTLANTAIGHRSRRPGDAQQRLLVALARARASPGRQQGCRGGPGHPGAGRVASVLRPRI